VISDDDTDSDGELIKYYRNDPKLPIHTKGLKAGMSTKDIVDALISISQEEKPTTCSKVPTNVSHNTLFVVDTWQLNDFWDIKCDDMGSWKNNGRKRSKTGIPGMDHDVYRQFYSPPYRLSKSL